jgi:hypothetical protein
VTVASPVITNPACVFLFELKLKEEKIAILGKIDFFSSSLRDIDESQLFVEKRVEAYGSFFLITAKGAVFSKEQQKEERRFWLDSALQRGIGNSWTGENARSTASETDKIVQEPSKTASQPKVVAPLHKQQPKGLKQGNRLFSYN